MKNDAKSQALAAAKSVDPLLGVAAGCVIDGCDPKAFAVEVVHEQVVDGARAACSALATPAVGALCGAGADWLWENGLKQTVGAVVDKVVSFIECLFGCDQPPPPILAIPPCTGAIDLGPTYRVQAGLALNLLGVVNGLSQLASDLHLSLTPGEALFLLGAKYALPLDRVADYPGDGVTFGFQSDGTLGPMAICEYGAPGTPTEHGIAMPPFPPEACYQDLPLSDGSHVISGWLHLRWPFDYMAPNLLTLAEQVYEAAPCFHQGPGRGTAPGSVTLRGVLAPGGKGIYTRTLATDLDAESTIGLLETEAQAWAILLKSSALACAVALTRESGKRFIELAGKETIAPAAGHRVRVLELDPTTRVALARARTIADILSGISGGIQFLRPGARLS